MHFISPTRTAIQQQCATVLVWPKIDFQTPYFDLSAPTLLFSYIRRSRSLTYSLSLSVKITPTNTNTELDKIKRERERVRAKERKLTHTEA